MAAISQTMFLDVFLWMKSFALFKSSLKFAPKDPIDNNLALV